MTWNWQQSDWPDFCWEPLRLAKAEEHFLRDSGVLIGSVRHLGSEDLEQITVEAISTEAITTSEIEGEVLDRASVQSSIRRQLGLAADKRRAGPAEQGIAEMTVDLYRGFAGPLSHEVLFAWYRMLMRGRREPLWAGGASLSDVGRYRTGREPMQVVSGSIHSPRVHFEAPPASTVAAEMSRFIEWFNRTAPHGGEPLPPLTRAGVAHLYFVSIHPFEDGNGRIGRAIAEKALAQRLGQPTLTALAATILIRRKAYYAALEAANQKNELTDWLCWFSGITIEAQRRTIAQVEFMIGKTRLLDRMRGHLNARQEKALLRMLREGPDGFEGGLSAGNYLSITGASPATATRDLADLVAKGVLIRHGERRHARYQVAIALKPVAAVTLGKDGEPGGFA
jgi:Fic family protein